MPSTLDHFQIRIHQVVAAEARMEEEEEVKIDRPSVLPWRLVNEW